MQSACRGHGVAAMLRGVVQHNFHGDVSSNEGVVADAPSD